MDKHITIPDPEQTVTVDLIAHEEIALHYPAQDVWPFVLHWNLFVDDKDFIEHRVTDSPDVEGEVKRISHFDERGRLDYSFFARAVKIVPYHQLVYKILSPFYSFDPATGAGSAIPMTGYEVLNVHEEKSSTFVSVDIFAESRPPNITVIQSQSLAEDYRTKTERAWRERYFPRLRDLLSKKAS